MFLDEITARDTEYQGYLEGALEAVAGTGVPGFAGDGGAAISAQVSNNIVALDVGPDGSVYIADEGNQVIRRVSPDGIITRFAGNGNALPVDAGMTFRGHGPALEVTLPLADIELTDDGDLWVASACGEAGCGEQCSVSPPVFSNFMVEMS